MTLLTKDEILDLKSKAELALKQVNMYVTKLREQGFNVAPGKDGTMYITKIITEVYGEPEGVQQSGRASASVSEQARIEEELTPECLVQPESTQGIGSTAA